MEQVYHFFYMTLATFLFVMSITMLVKWDVLFESEYKRVLYLDKYPEIYSEKRINIESIY